MEKAVALLAGAEGAEVLRRHWHHVGAQLDHDAADVTLAFDRVEIG